MPNDSLVYEVARMFNNRGEMERDMDEAASLVKNMFHKKYVTKMNDALEGQKQKALKNPSKEVELLKAMRPYIRKDSHQQLDYMINMFNIINMIGSMQNEMMGFNKVSLQSVNVNHRGNINPRGSIDSRGIENAIHEDGIYEFDNNCLLNRNSPGNKMTNMLLLLSLLRM